METFAPYVEEVSLGIIDDPHTDTPVRLTELVTVCPSCLSLHSLRKDDTTHIHCVVCHWRSRTKKPRAA